MGAASADVLSAWRVRLAFEKEKGLFFAGVVPPYTAWGKSAAKQREVRT